ncbi:hypothetical protein EVAR_96285_1 [Eumeta japonica]|uniref:Uncharacterized protein n=1 Tax=Eumeta variegata TaxID=151549 RepID=A0A4C1WL45_EUMVA|nr:hypothetical protein EVAR_96285_1 [Eumeta japonica]
MQCQTAAQLVNDGEIEGPLLIGHNVLKCEDMEIPMKSGISEKRPRRVLLAREKEVESFNTVKANSFSDSVLFTGSFGKEENETTRFCVDYRRLNDATKKDSIHYPELTIFLITTRDEIIFHLRSEKLLLSYGYKNFCLNLLDGVFCIKPPSFTPMPPPPRPPDDGLSPAAVRLHGHPPEAHPHVDMRV